MTECTADRVEFSSLGRKKIQADFQGGTISSDAGAVLLREMDRQLGLIDTINDIIADPRDPRYITHSQRSMIAQRIFAIALGYEDGNDHQDLRNDPLFQILADRRVDDEAPLASPPTLSRLENRVRREDMARIAELFVEKFLEAHPTPPEQIILDFDATDDPVHGRQEHRFFHGYYDHYCFLPLYVTCGPQLLVAYLRPSNIDAARHSWAILKLLVTRFRQVWPDVRILFRADSGFCRWRLMRWCDRHGVDYLLGLARNARLLARAADLLDQARTQFEATAQKQRLFADFPYAAETWDRPRRVIAKAEHGEQGPNPRFVVTSLPGDGQELYDRLYCQRGDAENRIKEQQLGLFADRTSCHAFLANQFRVLLSAAAYVLVETLRRVALTGTELAAAQATTIRLKLLKVGGRVVRSVRRLVIHLATGYPLQNTFRAILQRLRDWRCQPARAP